MRKFFALIIISPLFVLSQPLGNARINKLKKCVVKVYVEDGLSIGTGFIISDQGDVLTCWHVIQPSLKTDAKGTLLDIKKVFIEFANRDTVEMSIPLAYFHDKNEKAVSYDFCLLSPLQPFKLKKEFLKLGSFEDINEGDEIYTAGYPLGISDQFISKGILSSKYIDSSIIINNITKIKRSVALLDLTINRGNSGGPIIKLGKDISDDKVIGIADFLITKNGPNAEKLITELNDKKIDVQINDGKGNLINLIVIFKMFAEAIAYSSNGISGCVSINHFLQSLK
jgi:serine protease Do